MAGISGFFESLANDTSLVAEAGTASQRSLANRTLSVHPNWYFFADGSGNPIVLTGSHTWARRVEKKKWLSDGWNLNKFNKYLDFLQHWNHNYIRLWMWEHEGELDIWHKTPDGKYDLSKLNQAYFDRQRSFVAAAQARGLYSGVMLFRGWSGCCENSIPNWPDHPMHHDNNVNGIDGDPDRINYGNKVHSLDNPAIVKVQEAYIRKMIDTLNEFDSILWEIGNETIATSIPWKVHMVQFIRNYEKTKPRQHLVLTGTGNGVGNDSAYITKSDTFSPCVTEPAHWGSLNDPFVNNPPIPDERLGVPIILDNDHLGNHFLRFTALDQRRWTWKSFTRGNHPVHMDCYDVFWDGAEPTSDHPVSGVATNPHYDPQRKSLGDLQVFARKMDLAALKPTDDAGICSTTFCLASAGKEYLAYQPDTNAGIVLKLPAGSYDIELFDTTTGKGKKAKLKWDGGKKTFPKPSHAKEDWVLYIKVRS